MSNVFTQFADAITAETAKSGIGFALLQRLFGDEVLQAWGVQTSATPYASPMLAAMVIAAQVAMFFLPLIGLFIAISGLYRSTKDGLPKGWSPLFISSRILIASALSMPVTASGVSIIQIIVVGLALLGNGLANQGAVLLAEKIFDPSTGVVPVAVSKHSVDNTQLVEAFAAITAKQTCIVAAANMGYQPGDTVDGIDSMCGHTTYSTAQTAGALAGVPTTSNAVMSSDLNCPKMNYPYLCQTILQVNVNYAETIKAEMEAKGFLTDARVAELAKAYQKEIRTAINPDLERERAETIENMKKAGWPALGFYFSNLSRTAGATDQYIAGSSTSGFDIRDIPSISEAENAVSKSASHAYERAKNIARAADEPDFNFSGEAAGKTSALLTAAEKWTGSANFGGQNLLRAVMFGTTSVADGSVAGTNPFASPAIDSIGRLGAFSIGIGGAIEMVSSGVEKVADSVPTNGVSGNIIGRAFGNAALAAVDAAKFIAQYGATFGKLISVLCSGSGVALMVMMPMLPTIYITICVLEWLVALAVATIAVPLWGVFHALPQEGEGLLHQKTHTGWGLLAYIVLYPTLVVLGFAAAMMIFNVFVPTAGYMLTSYAPSGLGAEAGYFLLGLPITLVVMTVLAFTCLTLIIELPQRFATWIGLTDVSMISQQAKQSVHGALIPQHSIVTSATDFLKHNKKS